MIQENAKIRYKLPVRRQVKAIQNNENHSRRDTNGKTNEKNMLLFTLYLTNVEIFMLKHFSTGITLPPSRTTLQHISNFSATF